jgi:polar amino acid transport system substrate-binding protein
MHARMTRSTRSAALRSRFSVIFRNLFLPLMLLLPAQLSWAQELRLARNELAAEQAVAALILAEIYARLGMQITVQALPGARANALALAGEMDGEVGRVQSYADKNPALIQVRPAYHYLNSVAFAKSGKGIAIPNRTALKHYRVGIVRGIAHAENATVGLGNVETVRTYEQLFQMLESDRIDVAIDTSANGAYMIHKLGLKDIQAVGTLARLDLFHMLNPRQATLAPRLGAQIMRMKDSGELDKLSRRIEEDFMRNHATP